ncbi:hypothetical protein [Vibrio sp. Isolate24]|uniref:hypothetical protein n=1 Tax=Vibrio sp. Isolate24 TaxID=2908534 RepID=UPI001EFE27BA|nr:hypothetical protein [Vibrio sp. Isolate24]MCG9680936.1 hypothetical protein [Vibrio sp. Isolate24]
MIKYNWVCNQCSNVNQAGTDICTTCGCSAYATPDEIDARKDPSGYELRSFRALLDKKIIAFCYTPAFIVVFAFNGNLLALMLVALSIASLFITEFDFVKFIFKDKWAKKSIVGYGVSMLLFFLVRVTATNEVIVNTVIALILVSLLAMSCYLFKSQASEKFLRRYHKHHKDNVN